MDKHDTLEILEQVKSGSISTEQAFLLLREKPFEDLGFAKPDYHRTIRQGNTEVIYGAGKTAEQITAIASSLLKNGEKSILVTRINKQIAKEIAERHTLRYDPVSKLGIIGKVPEAQNKGKILIAAAGTSDIAVAEEAAQTAEALGNKTVRLYDVGVSGLHRLLSYMDEIMSARVIVVVAGMEGALASVIGGLTDCPVIGVPTSVGYGASMNGLSALLSMLNSCASGVSVVNIDNGFGAGYLASMINKIKEA